MTNMTPEALREWPMKAGWTPGSLGYQLAIGCADAWEADRRRLEALKTHVRHDEDCSWWKGLASDKSNEPCDCGLNAALAGEPAGDA